MRFGPFRLDLPNEQLRRGDRVLPLTPKAWAMLRHLVEHDGQLVTKDQLLDAVWPEVTVGDAVLKTAMSEIRRALRDTPQSPRFVETVHRRGYRFIARVTRDGTRPPAGDGRPEPVERESEIEALDSCFARALNGDRQVVFVTGEPGIGKSTLLEAFLARVSRTGDTWIARGECLERFAAGEPYQVVLEAIGRLAREHGRAVTDQLARFAPTWLVELPSLVDPRDRARLERDARGAGAERMLREMADAMEALARLRPLVIALEDLHWSDHATIDLLSSLARRAERVPLLVVGTYRPVEVIVHDHPVKTLKQELGAHGGCREIEVGGLSAAGVAEMLRRRLSGDGIPDVLAQSVYDRTEGNPLFVGNVIEYLLAQGALVAHEGGWRLARPLVEVGVPDTVREMLERHIDRLDDHDRRILEAGAVAGADFSVAEIGAALGENTITVEERCARLARRRQFLVPQGAPDEPRFRFIHALYAVVWLERVPLARRRDLHRRLGEHAEQGLGPRATEAAVQLAHHFEAAGDYPRTVRYLESAAQNASRRHAHREAEECYARALECADRCAETTREALRAGIRRARGLARRAVGDMLGASDDFEAVVAAARRSGEVDREVTGLLELASALMWWDRRRWQSVLEDVRTLAERVDDPWLKTHALGVCAECSLELEGWRAEDLEACERAAEAARARGDRALLGLHLANYAYFQLHCSHYADACRTAQEGHDLAVEVGEAYADFTCQGMRNLALLALGELGTMFRAMREGITKAERNGQLFAAHMLRLNEGTLSIETFALDRARALAEAALEGFRSAFFMYGELFARIVLGRAQLGLGRIDEGVRCLMETADLAPEVRLDWFFHMPLHQGLAEGWLATNDLARAGRHAAELVERARRPREAHFLATGHELAARIALAAGNLVLARGEVDRGLEVVSTANVPLAAWRTLETAGQIAERNGNHRDAIRFWKRSAATVQGLAASLGPGSELAASLLAAPRVRELLRVAEVDAILVAPRRRR